MRGAALSLLATRDGQQRLAQRLSDIMNGYAILPTGQDANGGLPWANRNAVYGELIMLA
jgi:cobalamin biosynthesis protein CbiG